jgi:tetratricopeptide (TPR) repeat protein
MKRLLAGRTSVTPLLAQSVLELGQEMLDMRTVEAAQAVYALLVPLSNDDHAREALFGLGRAYELAGEPVSAAAYYLRSALLVQAVAPDTLAFQSRLLAALNLMRAGLKNDARAQFDWLLKNSKDPALIEAAKRGLARL